MPASSARSSIRSGSKRPDLMPSAQRGPAASGMGGLLTRPLSPAVSPRDAVAGLVETGAGPGAVEQRRSALAKLQRAYGNQYAARVVAEFRARQSDGEQQPSTDPTEQAQTAPPKAASARPTPASTVAAEPAAIPATAAPAAPAPAAAKPTGKSVGALPPANLAKAVAPPAAPSAELATPAPAKPPAPEPAAAPAAASAAAPAAAGPAATAAAEEPAAPKAPPAEAAEAPAAKEGEGAAKAEAAPAAEAPAPKSPDQDPAFLAVVGRARAVQHQQGHNNPAKRKAAEAQAAAPGPANEVQAQAQAAQVAKMDAQEPKTFDRAGFKAALLAKIAEITPKNIKEADQFKEQNKAASIKGAVTDQVKTGKDAAQSGIKQTAEQAPDPSVGQPKQVTPMPPTEAGPAPADIGASGAAPKQKSEGEVSLQAESKGLDNQLADANVKPETLQKSNEDEFKGALAAKNDAQTDAATAPAAYRQQEESILATAKTDVAASAATKTQGMHAVRGDKFGQILGTQVDTQSADKAERDKVVQNIEGIYKRTESAVKKCLDQLDTDVNKIFDDGAEAARKTFESYVDEKMTSWKLERYLLKPGGTLLFLKDELLGLPDEVNVFYEQGRQRYIDAMDGVIDSISIAVETGLNTAKQLIKDGKTEVDTYVAGLDPALKQVGEGKAAEIQTKFDTLRDSVDEKGNQLVDQLAQKYVEKLQAIDDRINEMKAANRGLVDKAKEQIQGVIDTIMNLKNMLMGVLAKAADAIDKIIADPIGFLGNLIAGVKGGLSAFMSNIGSHLKKGLMEWLFGALAGAGIQLPDSFDLKGIISLVLQVLGLTYANFRARAVAILGEPIVKALETAAEVFKILATEGISGLWRFIKDKVGDIKSMIMDAILAFVRDRVIIAGITWLIGLLNPASAFVKACKAIYDIIMFFVNRGSQIMALVNAVTDSISSIASGAIGVAVNFVENALAKAIPVAIGFLASLLGLGDISGTLRNTIQKAQSPVNNAMDWVINQAAKLVKAAGGFIKGLFGKKDKGAKDDQPETDNPEHDAKVTAGLADIDQEEQKYMTEDGISREDAEKVAATVKQKHPVFKAINVVEGDESWDYDYSASKGKKKGEKRAADGSWVVGGHTVKNQNKKGESHHVPQKVLRNWFGEIYRIAARETDNPLYKAKASEFEGDSVGGGLSAIWLSEKDHKKAHQADIDKGQIETAKNIIVTTVAGNVSSKAQRTGTARSVLEKVDPSASTSGSRKSINRKIYDAIADTMGTTFKKVYRGMLAAGIAGVNAVGLKGAWKGAIQSKAEETWGPATTPAKPIPED